MSDQEVIDKTAAFIKEKFSKEPTGHDWWHMYRVWQLARHINKTENADRLIVELGALLHDIADWKFYEDEEVGPRAARAWLEGLKVEEAVIQHVEDIIRNISFKGAKVKNNLNSKEGQIVHDADKLDAIGAIGIARTFHYSGAHNWPIYNPEYRYEQHDTPETFKNDSSGAVSHFYDKLLLLKDRMFTETGKKMAAHRHKVLKQYLEEFYSEWKGEF